MGANNNQPKSGRMVVVAAAMVAAMTVATAAAVTVATAAAEMKAAVATAMAALTAAEAAANVAALVAEILPWQRLQQLQLWHVGKIVLLSTILTVRGQVQDLSSFQMDPIPFLSDLTCSTHSPHDILKVWKKIDHNLPIGHVKRDIRVLGGCSSGFFVGF